MTPPVARASGGVALTLCAVILLATALHLARIQTGCATTMELAAEAF